MWCTNGGILSLAPSGEHSLNSRPSDRQTDRQRDHRSQYAAPRVFDAV